MIEIREKMISGLLGLVVGEAAGIPFLSTEHSAMKYHPMTGMNGPEDTFAWGEATALSLASMDSIVKTGRMDYTDIMDRFLAWLENGKYCPQERPTYVPITVKYSLLRYKNGIHPLMCGAYDYQSTSVSPAARILPAAYYLYRKLPEREDQVILVNCVCGLTHGNELCYLGSMILSDYVGFLLDGFKATEALQNLQYFDYRKCFMIDSCDAYERILSGEIFSLQRSDISSSAHIVNVLEASLWCVLNTENYRDAVIKAINLGGATDYIAAVTGALAGILYGRKTIPQEWINALQAKTYLTDEIYRFVNFI